VPLHSLQLPHSPKLQLASQVRVRRCVPAAQPPQGCSMLSSWPGTQLPAAPLQAPQSLHAPKLQLAEDHVRTRVCRPAPQA
jgi:hypothetical protein